MIGPVRLQHAYVEPRYVDRQLRTPVSNPRVSAPEPQLRPVRMQHAYVQPQLSTPANPAGPQRSPARELLIQRAFTEPPRSPAVPMQRAYVEPRLVDPQLSPTPANPRTFAAEPQRSDARPVRMQAAYVESRHVEPQLSHATANPRLPAAEPQLSPVRPQRYRAEPLEEPISPIVQLSPVTRFVSCFVEFFVKVPVLIQQP